MKNILNFNVSFYENEIIIWDSFKIKYKDIKTFIDALYIEHETSNLLKQDKSILCAELFVHNVLYDLGIKRNKTKDCNLSLYSDFSFFEKCVYTLVSKVF